MSCMCGDICCRSCGPAQGNYCCSACGAWTSDGGCQNPKECGRILREHAAAEERAYQDSVDHRRGERGSDYGI